MNNELSKIGITTALLGVLFMSTLSFTRADEAGKLSEGSLAISPFLIETRVAPGGTYTDSITVFNVTDAPLPISISINDFVPSGEHGSVRFLESSELSHPSFSLASWISITDQPTFIIQPKGETKVGFKMSVPADAEPGSHYGGLLFSASTDTRDAVGTKVVKKVGALIIVATGKTNASGNIISFTSNQGFYAKPDIVFTSSFKNTGNVHVAPKGQIAVRNIFGKVIAESHANKDANLVLPGQSRIFESEFKNNWMFGRYTAELTYYFGNPKLEANEKISFWVLPVKQISLIIGSITILILLIIGYNRWIIRRSRV